MIDLAIREGSFFAEYRVDSGGFDVLLVMLRDQLSLNDNMAARDSRLCKSAAILVESQLAAVLILLSGGRMMEAMRTHGLGRSTAYQNFSTVYSRQSIAT